jgi:stress response protein SCP2/uncharacterized protein (AIM24 family)
MTRMLTRGQKVPLDQLTPATDLVIGIQLVGANLAFDVSCFGLDADQRLSDDRYFIFFNQPSSPESAITQTGPNGVDQQTFTLRLPQIPTAVDRLVFVANIDGAGTLGQLQSGWFRVLAGGAEVARYDFTGGDFTSEAAVMMAELYRRNGWRIGVIGQGFAGGLDAVVHHYGGEVADAAPAAPPPVPPPVPPPPTTAPPLPPPPAPPGAPPPPAGYAPGPPAPALPANAGVFANPSLAQYAEPVSHERFTVYKKKMLKVVLGQEVHAKQGAMVAYQGSVTFDHKGAGMKGFLKSKVTGEGMSLMKVGGQGEVFLADQSSHIYLIQLEGDGLSINGRNVLAFDPSLTWDIRKVEGVGFLSSGTGFFNVVLQGEGTVAITSQGQPVALEAPALADPNAIVGWSSGLRIRPHRSAGLKALIGRGSGEAMQLSFEGQGWVIVQPSEV